MQWHEQGTIEHNAGDMVGGDPQAGPSVSRRFVFGPVAGNYMVITEYAYADKIEQHVDGTTTWRYGDATTTETIICTDLEDVGGTELDADYEYGTGTALFHETVDQATDAAERTIKRTNVDLYEHYDPTEELRAGRLNR